MRLVINDEDDDDATDGAPGDEDESNIALRYLGNVTKKCGITYDVGLRGLCKHMVDPCL